jgi:hypothetical protein
MENLDLTALAADTASRLSSIWDELGVGPQDRAAFLDALAVDVAAIYSSRVQGEMARKAGIEAEIEQLRITIQNMITAMEEAASVVSNTRARNRKKERSRFWGPHKAVSSREHAQVHDSHSLRP